MSRLSRLTSPGETVRRRKSQIVAVSLDKRLVELVGPMPRQRQPQKKRSLRFVLYARCSRAAGMASNKAGTPAATLSCWCDLECLLPRFPYFHREHRLFSQRSIETREGVRGQIWTTQGVKQ